MEDNIPERPDRSLLQGVKVGTLGRQNERNSSYVRLAHTSIFGLCFMSVCLMKSNCYSLIYSSLVQGSTFLEGQIQSFINFVGIQILGYSVLLYNIRYKYEYSKVCKIFFFTHMEE